jgi:hypothetical protein
MANTALKHVGYDASNVQFHIECHILHQGNHHTYAEWLDNITLTASLNAEQHMLKWYASPAWSFELIEARTVGIDHEDWLTINGLASISGECPLHLVAKLHKAYDLSKLTCLTSVKVSLPLDLESALNLLGSDIVRRNPIPGCVIPFMRS